MLRTDRHARDTRTAMHKQKPGTAKQYGTRFHTAGASLRTYAKILQKPALAGSPDQKTNPNPSKSLPERHPSHPRGSQGQPGRLLKASRHGPGTLLESPRAAPMIPGDAPSIPKDHPRPPEGTTNGSLALFFGKRAAGRVHAWIFDRFSFAFSKSGPS